MRSIPAHTDAMKAIDCADARLADQSSGPRRLDSRMLFAGGSEVTIVHGTDVYRLRLTRQNKLILTK